MTFASFFNSNPDTAGFVNWLVECLIVVALIQLIIALGFYIASHFSK